MSTYSSKKNYQMSSRRKFVKKLGLTSLLPFISKSKGLSLGHSCIPKDPIMISTWNHGLTANKAGFQIIINGGSAIDAVEKAVVEIENDPENKTVGIGGYPDRDGNVTLDACIMKGDGSCGSVAFLQNIQNPISVAKLVMEETPHIMLVGEGAKKFAMEHGFKEVNLLTESTKKDYENWLKDTDYVPMINIENHDTVSTLALDNHGNLAGACTTSGAAWKMHGRVGDSPIIGAGLFVDEEVGAAAATGWGEAVISTSGSAMVVEAMRNGMTPSKACEYISKRIMKKYPNVDWLQVGFIALDKYGNTGAFSLKKGFNYAVTTKDKHELIDANYLM